jgi:hypothetical protein
MRHLNRRFAGIVTALAAFALLAGTALAYTNPYGLKPGVAGGPPTAPNGSHGTSTTNAGATQLGYLLAGYTPGQLLALQTFTLTVHFPRAGPLYGRIGVPGGGEIGEGFAGRANAGNKPMSVSLSAKGRTDLYQDAELGRATTITLKYAFQPNVGRTEYSTASVVTNP